MVGGSSTSVLVLWSTKGRRMMGSGGCRWLRKLTLSLLFQLWHLQQDVLQPCSLSSLLFYQVLCTPHQAIPKWAEIVPCRHHQVAVFSLNPASLGCRRKQSPVSQAPQRTPTRTFGTQVLCVIIVTFLRWYFLEHFPLFPGPPPLHPACFSTGHFIQIYRCPFFLENSLTSHSFENQVTYTELQSLKGNLWKKDSGGHFSCVPIYLAVSATPFRLINSMLNSHLMVLACLYCFLWPSQHNSWQ